MDVDESYLYNLGPSENVRVGEQDMGESVGEKDMGGLVSETKEGDDMQVDDDANDDGTHSQVESDNSEKDDTEIDGAEKDDREKDGTGSDDTENSSEDKDMNVGDSRVEEDDGENDVVKGCDFEMDDFTAAVGSSSYHSKRKQPFSPSDSRSRKRVKGKQHRTGTNRQGGQLQVNAEIA